MFHGQRTEHLSADEVYARATQSLPDLSRGTVYATLAEFTELGLLSAFGAPEPVRYETNTTRHAHFRCRLCLRLFDLEHGLHEPELITERGFQIERVETLAEGVCADCGDYASGLAAAARAIKRSGAPGDALGARGAASIETQTPLGAILLAATPHGLIRVAFDDHADADALRALAASRRGSHAARAHLSQTAEKLRYFAGATDPINCEIDWEQLLARRKAALQATATIPYATTRSYNALGLDLTAHELGSIMGANPIPIVTPCHRVTRGSEIPTIFVGGPARRHWLERHEREHAPRAS